VSRQKRRPAVGGSNAGVVSIGVGGNHRPDYSRIACGQIAAARHKLGMDLEEFARHIREATGWDMLPEAIEAWEDDVVPPGDVVIACMTVTQGLPGLALPLLADIPPAFPAETLAGPWVTCYQFSHDREPRYHADIAHVTIGPGGHIRATNHPPEPRSEGRERPFRNEIDGQLTGRHVGGEWMNTSDTRYYGWFQLAVLPGEIVMQGGYYGVASDIEVSSGAWTWVRLDLGPVPPTGFTLRDPHELYDLVTNHSQYGAPLTLADVREEP
jgi:hypothetical protein